MYASVILPIFFGLLSLLLFYQILILLKVERLNRVMILFLFLMSPIFIYTFTLSTPLCFVLFLQFLAFYLLLKKKTVYFVLSLLCFILIALSGILHALIFIIGALILAITNKKRLKQFYIIISVGAVSILVFRLPIYLQSKTFFLTKPILNLFMSDLGAIFGFSTFSILLSVFGLITLWKYKKKHYFLYVFMFAIFIYSFFHQQAALYSNIIISFFAGIAFAKFIKRKWTLFELKNFVILIIFCGILFSAVSHASLLSSLPPNDSLIDGLEWLAKNSKSGEKVFSQVSNAFYIQLWAERPVLYDPISKTDRELEDSNTVFYSNDLKITKSILSKHGIRYIFLIKDKAMEDKGIFFIATNSENFKKRHHNSHIIIYEYTPEKK